MIRFDKHIVPPLAFVLALLMWGYCARTRQLAGERLNADGFPERNFSDLFPPWLAARSLLLDGRDPYSPQVTKEIQRGYYGRPIDSARQTDPIDQQAFAYPLFVVFLLAPTIYLPFTIVKPLFTLILLACAAGTVFLWIQFLGVKLRRENFLTCVLLTLASIPYAAGVQYQQLSVLVAFFLAAAVRALAAKKFAFAGSLLAIATVKPQLALYFIGCLLLWSGWRWRSRKWLVISFFTSLVALILASEVLLPDWPSEFLASIPRYLRYTRATTGVHELFGSVGGTIILLVFAALIALASWRAKSDIVDSDDFRLAISSVLVFTCIVIPSLAPHNQVLLVPAYLLLAKERKRIWEGGRIARALWSGAWLTVIWPWLVGAMLATSLVFHRGGSRLWDLPLATNPLIPITAFAALIPLILRQPSRAAPEMSNADRL